MSARSSLETIIDSNKQYESCDWAYISFDQFIAQIRATVTSEVQTCIFSSYF